MTNDLTPYRADDIEKNLDIRLMMAVLLSGMLSIKKTGDSEFSLKYRLADQPRSAQMLAFWSIELHQLEASQNSEGIEQPALWLTSREAALLQQVLKRRDIDYIWVVASNIITAQRERISDMRLKAFYDAQRQMLDSRDNLIPIDNEQMLGLIKSTLKEDALGKQLLEFADASGVTLSLQQQRTSSFPAHPTAFADGDTIYIVNSDVTNIADCAVRLAHMLRQHWQEKRFEEFFRENNTDADILVRSRLLKADAYTVQTATAFTLKRLGVGVPGNVALQHFEANCLSNGWLGPNPQHALHHAMSGHFLHSAAPGRLDRHEYTCIPQIEAMKKRGSISAEIDKSLYSQENFIRELTQIGNESYVNATHMREILRELRGIGQSQYAHQPMPIVRPLPFTL